MSQIYSFNSNPQGVKRIANVLDLVQRGETRAADITGVESLNSIFGKESFSLADGSSSLSFSQQHASVSAAKNVLASDFEKRLATEQTQIAKSAGFESFSAALTEGAVARQKTATIELNAEANRQFKAAEAMYPTVFIGYDETMLELPIDIAGVGQYNVGGNVYDQFEDLRPIPSILADSSFTSGDDLKLVPVFVDDETDPSYDRFVDKALWEPVQETYDQNDLLGREPHLTNYLAPVKLGNLMNLCRAPGTPKWENNDEIEASSIRITSLLFKIKTKDGEGVYTLDTSAFPSNAMRTANHLNSKSARQLILKSEGTPVTAFKDKDGKDASDLFKSLGEDLSAFLQWDIRLEYHRDTRTLSPTITPDVTIHHVVDAKGNRLIAGTSKVPAETQALIKAQAVEASIAGYKLAMNHNNVNWSRYGQTIVYANTLKQYNVRRRQPISVKYPMSNDDTNTEVLAKCIRDMGLVISRNMTHDAFKFAIRHFDYLVENNGKKVVPINDDSNDVLPGQHFFATTAADETINLKKATSTLDSKDALANIQAVLVNKITDVITDIRVRSGFAAVKEIDGRNEEYVIVAHAVLAPYLMTSGDVRTFGQNVKFSVIETNVDTEIGRFWIFPKSETRDGNIDAFGGMGVCVAKELLVIEGDVRMDERQYRMQICQPAYEHHSTGCIAGRVYIEDIEELMNDGGVLSAINRHLQSTIVESLPESSDGGDGGNGGGAGTGDEVDITKPDGE